MLSRDKPLIQKEIDKESPEIVIPKGRGSAEIRAVVGRATQWDETVLCGTEALAAPLAPSRTLRKSVHQPGALE